jgi:hypothetical protein
MITQKQRVIAAGILSDRQERYHCLFSFRDRSETPDFGQLHGWADNSIFPAGPGPASRDEMKWSWL